METATGQAEHWDDLYGHGDTTRSWFQAQAGWSLRMFDRAGISAADSVIDVGGGSSPLAAALLARGHSDITVLDVSVVGIRVAQQRLGTAAQHVQWLVGDVRTWQPQRRYLVWHDRALFHFMTSDQDREAYLQALESATRLSAYLKTAKWNWLASATADSRASRGRRPDSHCPRSQWATRRSRPAELSRNQEMCRSPHQNQPHRTSEAVSQSSSWQCRAAHNRS